MTERAAVLDGLGVSRRLGSREREARQGLELPSADMRLTVAYGQAVPAAAVWDFFRTGDRPALVRALLRTARPPAGGRADRAARCAGRARAGLRRRPARLAGTGAAVECAQPQAAETLIAACQRAFERWVHRVHEQDTLEDLNDAACLPGLSRQLRRGAAPAVPGQRSSSARPTAARPTRPSSAWRRPRRAPIWRRCACSRWRAATGCGILPFGGVR